MTPVKDSGPLRIGDVFEEDFQILELLGEGGYGCVYRAMEKYTSREVAIKITKNPGKQDDELYARTLREAKILGTLGNHDNIVQVFAARFSKKGQFYIVMELLKGTDLGRYLAKRGSPGVSEGLILLEKLCGALAFAHEHQVIHRDIKPGNIFIPERGEPKVLDFGIAKIADYGGFQTAPRRLIGTTLYISPEQVRGQPATSRSDIYSLGLVAFQIFSHGHHTLLLQEPHVNRYDARAICGLHLRTLAPRLDQVIEGFPQYVAKLVNTMLAKEPAQRFGDARQLAEELRAALLKYETDQRLDHMRRDSYVAIAPTERGARLGNESKAPQEQRGASYRDAAPEAPPTPPLEKRSTRKLFEEGKNNVPEIPLATFTGPKSHKISIDPLTPPSASRTKTVPSERAARHRVLSERHGYSPLRFVLLVIVGTSVGAGLMILFGPGATAREPLTRDQTATESTTSVAAPNQETVAREAPSSATPTAVPGKIPSVEEPPHQASVPEQGAAEAHKASAPTSAATNSKPATKVASTDDSRLHFPLLEAKETPRPSPQPRAPSISKKEKKVPEIEAGLDEDGWLQ